MCEIYILVIILVISVYYDIKYYKIPNKITIPAMFMGLACGIFSGGLEGLFNSWLGLLAGIGILIIPFIFRMFGAGDVKLLAAIGSFLGATGIFTAFLFASLIGGVVSLAILLRDKGWLGLWSGFKHFLLAVVLTRRLCLSTTSSRTGTWFCYGPVIAAGTIAALIWNAMGFEYIRLF